MMTRIARVLAGTAVVVALAASAACGNDPTNNTNNVTDPTAEPTSSTEADSTERLFPPGGGGQAAPVRVPTAKVNETKEVTVEVKNGTGKPQSYKPPSATPNNHKAQFAASLPSCPASVPPEGTCRFPVRVTPREAGSYSGVLTVETSEGETLIVPISGEAVGDEPTDTVSPTSEIPLPTEPTPTETEIVPTETEPEPEIT
ncbi:hypothetical protein ACFY8W_29785 [Streptomyces sp. NPDC012637]|uniref:hypothetical protein n=1 Tax=Streptomyces sp. NPDC012637 TaxID=3364842 RepID=UPI0036EB74C6